MVLIRVKHAIPVNQHIESLRKYVGVEPAIPGGGLIPDLAARSLRGIETGFA